MPLVAVGSGRAMAAVFRKRIDGRPGPCKPARMKAAILLLFVIPGMVHAQTVWTRRQTPTHEGLSRPFGKPGVYLIPTSEDTGTAQIYLRSVNGTDWARQSLRYTNFSFGIPALACANNRFVGVGNDEVWYSDNGTTSTKTHTLDSTWSSPFNIAFGNGVWLITESNGDVLRSTTNAASWTVVTTPADYLGAIVFGAGKFVVESSGASLHSVNGLDWTIHPEVPGYGLSFGAGEFATQTHRSTDALSWTARTEADYLPNNSGFLRSGNGGLLTWDNEAQPSFYEFKDGAWSAAHPSGVVSSIGDAGFCGDLWIAVTDSGNVLTSPIPSVPAPVAPALQIAPAFRLSWQSANGRSYIIQRSVNQTTWADQTGIMLGTGGPMEWLAPASATKEFFRVQVR
jgi:hypothetical protein